MKKVDALFFKKMNFDAEQVMKYNKSAEHNLRIAESTDIPEVIFKFSYDALIKIGVTLIAFKGFKIKSRLGHHVKILETLSEILDDKDVEIVGNAMRMKRNLDLYGEEAIIGKKEAKEYLSFIKGVFNKAKNIL